MLKNKYFSCGSVEGQDADEGEPQLSIPSTLINGHNRFIPIFTKIRTQMQDLHDPRRTQAGAK